jgi:superkiller protein 3
MSAGALDDHAHALDRFEAALAVDAGNAVALQEKGRSLMRMGRFAEARLAFGEAETGEPRNADIHMDLACCLNDMKEHAEALKHAERAIELEPEHFSGWNNKGIALFHLGLVEQAELALRRALELDPRNAEAWNNLGYVLGQAGRIDEALLCVARAMELAPGYLQPYFNRSHLLCVQGRAREGVRVLDALLAVEPTNERAREIREALLRHLGQP